MTDLKENNKIIEDDPLKGYRGKWKVMLFSKQGWSLLGVCEYDTEGEANHVAQQTTEQARKEAKEYPARVYSLCIDKVSSPYAHEVSHCIALPVGGGA